MVMLIFEWLGFVVPGVNCCRITRPRLLAAAGMVVTLPKLHPAAASWERAALTVSPLRCGTRHELDDGLGVAGGRKGAGLLIETVAVLSAGAESANWEVALAVIVARPAALTWTTKTWCPVTESPER